MQALSGAVIRRAHNVVQARTTGCIGTMGLSVALTVQAGMASGATTVSSPMMNVAMPNAILTLRSGSVPWCSSLPARSYCGSGQWAASATPARSTL